MNLDNWINKIILGDCTEIIKEIPNESIDCIIIHPPYFLPACHYNTRTLFSRNFADLGILEYFFKSVFKDFNRIMKKDGIIYVFCDGQSYPLFYYYLYPFCKSVRPLIWNKKRSINGYSWRHQHEIIIFAELPKAKPIPSGEGDIIECLAVPVNKRKHPAEKPIELLSKLIEKSTKENDIIFDCFAGSGSTLVAAKKLNRRFIGIEKDNGYYEIASKRIGSGIIEYTPKKEKIIKEVKVVREEPKVDWKKVFDTNG